MHQTRLEIDQLSWKGPMPLHQRQPKASCIRQRIASNLKEIILPLFSALVRHTCCAQLWASQLKTDTEAKPVKLNNDDYGTGASNVK